LLSGSPCNGAREARVDFTDLKCLPQEYPRI
jgi:hypothetical protein